MTYRVNVNGRLVRADEGRISVFDSAYLYGEGVFETLLARRGQVIDLDRHLLRLNHSVRRIGMAKRPVLKRLRREILRTLRANRLRDAYIRIDVSTLEGALGSPRRREVKLHFVIFVHPHRPYSDHLYRKGARVVVVRGVRNDPLPLAAIKSTNYLTKMMARREAAHRGADEGILLNLKGRITEGAGSSFFVVKGGRLLTPPLTEGLLPGITREAVIRLARHLGVPFREKPLTVAEARRADEIFIVSTLKRILPVGDFEGVRKRAPGLITERLMSAFDAGSSESRTP